MEISYWIEEFECDSEPNNSMFYMENKCQDVVGFFLPASTMFCSSPTLVNQHMMVLLYTILTDYNNDLWRSLGKLLIWQQIYLANGNLLQQLSFFCCQTCFMIQFSRIHSNIRKKTGNTKELQFTHTIRNHSNCLLNSYFMWHF